MPARNAPEPTSRACPAPTIDELLVGSSFVLGKLFGGKLQLCRKSWETPSQSPPESGGEAQNKMLLAPYSTQGGEGWSGA